MTPTLPSQGEAALNVGDKIKDNDPRMPHRVLTITDILPNGVVARDKADREFSYLRRRIYTDGKPRKSGFSLQKDKQP